jgi:hypothetical protein
MRRGWRVIKVISGNRKERNSDVGVENSRGSSVSEHVSDG